MRATGILTVIGAAFAIIGLTAVCASAGSGPVVTVPEPGTLTTLASTIVAGIIGYRWIRRR